jgi:hypothetical protein
MAKGWTLNVNWLIPLVGGRLFLADSSSESAKQCTPLLNRSPEILRPKHPPRPSPDEMHRPEPHSEHKRRRDRTRILRRCEQPRPEHDAKEVRLPDGQEHRRLVFPLISHLEHSFRIWLEPDITCSTLRRHYSSMVPMKSASLWLTWSPSCP